MNEALQRPGPFRLLMAMLYDNVLLLSVLMLASTLPVILNQGEAITAGNPFFALYLLLVSLFFYGWFWTHGGQTLGMRAWKIYLISETQYRITWQQVVLRFVTAMISWLCVGVGVIWQWTSKDKRSWHDKASNTYLIYKKPAK